LLVQGEVLEGELAVAAAKKGQEAKQLEQKGDHRTRIFSGSEPADQPLPAGLNFGEGQASRQREELRLGLREQGQAIEKAMAAGRGSGGARPRR
jgi:hypothetical protein